MNLSFKKMHIGWYIACVKVFARSNLQLPSPHKIAVEMSTNDWKKKHVQNSSHCCDGFRYLAVLSSLPVTSMLPSSLRTMQLMLSSWSAMVSSSSPFFPPLLLPAPILDTCGLKSPAWTEELQTRRFQMKGQVEGWVSDGTPSNWSFIWEKNRKKLALHIKYPTQGRQSN